MEELKMKYLIHTKCVATDSNPNFKGEVQNWISGKGGYVWRDTERNRAIMTPMYGYTRRGDATRVLHRKQEMAEKETARGAWYVSVDIVSVSE